jgi:Na+/proline symporter
MGSADSALASLSTAFVVDFYKPFWGKGASEAKCVKVSKISFVFFGIVFMVFALGLHSLDNLLWLAFRLIAFTYGPLLGIFSVTILTDWKVSARKLLPVMYVWTIGSFLLAMVAWQSTVAAKDPSGHAAFAAWMTAHASSGDFLQKLHTDYWRYYIILGALLIPGAAYVMKEN